jgi:hypothetical protein
VRSTSTTGSSVPAKTAHSIMQLQTIFITCMLATVATCHPKKEAPDPIGFTKVSPHGGEIANLMANKPCTDICPGHECELPKYAYILQGWKCAFYG